MDLMLRPAMRLMQRLRLFPKFALVALVFIAPLVLVTTLLLNELHHSISLAEQERTGVRDLRQLQEIIRLTQQHRALRHLLLSGNADLKQQAEQVQAALNARIAESAALAGTREWTDAKQAWATLQDKLPTARSKESFEHHTAVIGKLYRLSNLLADRSGLTLDPEVSSHYLVTAFVHTLPGIAEGLSTIASRGAAYIDTGLLEGGEDVLLNSSVMVARHDLSRISSQMDALAHENREMWSALTARFAAVSTALVFLERAQNEVLNSYNQTSGKQFLGAGTDSIDELYVAAHAAASLLDATLEKRVEHLSLRRNLMLAAVLAALAIAGYLLAGFFASFSREVRRLEQAVASAAQGDLAHHVASGATDEIGNLANAFGGMSSELAKLVARIRAGSETITGASCEISAGNAALAERTESQVSSLQQTASSMEQLTSTVKHNAENAKAANRIAASAADAARKGGHMMQEVVETMGAIKQSSGQVMNIIGVINGIAFQTNLLALNAAVEAARAGSQGRGFAVVAAEVRGLAQRSAEAAKEIKSLIGTSVGKIEAGNELVAAAGVSMEKIVGSIGRVVGIMSEISDASQEQTAGIEQINQAVTQLDQTTRQNALLVEQAGTAADALQRQAEDLSQAVSAFKLDARAVNEVTLTV